MVEFVEVNCLGVEHAVTDVEPAPLLAKIALFLHVVLQTLVHWSQRSTPVEVVDSGVSQSLRQFLVVVVFVHDVVVEVDTFLRMLQHVFVWEYLVGLLLVPLYLRNRLLLARFGPKHVSDLLEGHHLVAVLIVALVLLVVDAAPGYRFLLEIVAELGVVLDLLLFPR